MFDFTLKHIPGNRMEKTDSLNKRLDQKVEVKRNNENKILIKLEWLEVKRTKKIKIIIERVDLLEEIKQLKVIDNKVVKVVKETK